VHPQLEPLARAALALVPAGAAPLTIGPVINLIIETFDKRAYRTAGAADALEESGDMKGAVALRARGDLTFSDKVKNAAAAGAVGALIYNNVPGGYAATLDGPGPIPALATTREQGLAFKNDPHARVRLYVTPDGLYTRFTGTSMSAPHVTGVVALILSVNPTLDPAGVRLILEQTATDLGDKGRDDLYGDGLVNAVAAVQAARAAAPALGGAAPSCVSAPLARRPFCAGILESAERPRVAICR